MDENLIRLLYFLFLALLNRLSFHWIWNLACQSAGVTKQEVWRYRASIRHHKHTYRYLHSWLIGRSPNPKKTSRLLSLYSFHAIPIVLCINLAVLGFSTDIFDEILKYAAIIMPFIIAAITIIGIFYQKSTKKTENDLPDKKKPLTEQIKFILTLIFEKDVNTSSKKYKGNTTKFIVVNTVKLVVMISIIIGVFFLTLYFFTNPKTLATTEQVWNVLISNGYEPLDTTELYLDTYSNLKQSIGVDTDNFHFEFFTFKSSRKAEQANTQIFSFIHEAKYSPGIEYEESAANYSIYTLTVDGTYTILLRVGSTVVYAYAEEKNAATILNILQTIGYLQIE